MIYVFVALIGGAVGACIAVYFLGNRFPRPEEKTETRADSDNLNKEQSDRADRLKELERQHENMMNYTGKEQKRA